MRVVVTLCNPEEWVEENYAVYSSNELETATDVRLEVLKLFTYGVKKHRKEHAIGTFNFNVYFVNDTVYYPRKNEYRPKYRFKYKFAGKNFSSLYFGVGQKWFKVENDGTLGKIE